MMPSEATVTMYRWAHDVAMSTTISVREAGASRSYSNRTPINAARSSRVTASRPGMASYWLGSS